MSINYNTSEYDKNYIEWLKEENRKLAELLRWHTFPEEKPTKDTFYRVTVDIGIGTSVTDLYYHSRTDVWMFNGGKVCKAPVLAWKELDKPYKKENA